jgi:hypothetical protein
MRARLAGQVALLTATGGLAAGALTSWVGSSTSDELAAVVVRTLTVGALVVLAPYLAVRRHVLDDHRVPLLLAGAGGSLLGYVANPWAWRGEAFFTQLFTQPGVVTSLVDLAGWTALGTVAASVASRAASGLHQPLGYEA